MEDKLKLYDRAIIFHPTLSFELFEALFDECVSEFIGYCHISYEAEASSLILKMIRHKFNQLGAEGLNSQSVSGQSESYSSSYDDNIMRELRSFRRLGI